MLKRILVISFIYSILMLALTLNMDKIGNSYIVLVLILSLAFSVLLIREVYKKYVVHFKSENTEINYQYAVNSDLGYLKKISTRPFLLGLENKLVSEDEFYFDEAYFYAINKDLQKAIFKLTDIIELKKTSIQINNRRLWSVKIKEGVDKEITFKFAHNYTFWNKNFIHFYEKIKLINPSVIKSEFNGMTL